MSHIVRNPVWQALTSRHAPLALGDARARRYPGDVAPFFAVADASVPAADVLALMAPGETGFVVDVLPDGLVAEPVGDILQMRLSAPVDVPGEPALELGEADVPDMLELTSIAYPFFFRPRTRLLGRYVGIRVDGRLVAMAGERMATHEAQEISAICTHPEHLGRGYAARLTRHVAAGAQARGDRAFLHVSAANTRAVDLYLRLGFAVDATLPFWRTQRPG